MHQDASQAAMTGAKDTLAPVVHGILKLQENWSTNIATRDIDFVPVIHLLDDLSDDAASLIGAVFTFISSIFLRCTDCQLALTHC